MEPMNTQPLVSVIMPTYNRCDLICYAIDSVINQTYSNWELIIVDDGSTDQTETLIKNKYSDETRIRYVQQKNQGQSVARNYGIESSTGELVAFLDSDNIWLNNRLQKGIEVMLREPQVGLCFADVIYIDAKGVELGRKNMPRYSGLVFSKMIVDNFVSMNTVLVKKSILPSLRPFNEKNRLDEDYELWLDLSVNNEFYYIPDYLAEYRVEGERISNNFMIRLDGNLATVNKIIHKYQIDTRSHDVKEGLGFHYLRRAGLIGRNGGFAQYLAAWSKCLTYIWFSVAPYKQIIRLFLWKIGMMK